MPTSRWRWRRARRGGSASFRPPRARSFGIHSFSPRSRTAWRSCAGRARLTVGPGLHLDAQRGPPRAGVAVMREAVRDLRLLLAGEAVGFGPTATRLRNRSGVPTPVFLLAAGPRMIELAGEVADGAFLMVGLHPAAIRAARGSPGRGRTTGGPAIASRASRWSSWSRLVSAPMPTSARAGCGAGSHRGSPSSRIRASRISAGSARPASRCRGARSDRGPGGSRARSRMRSASSARPSVAPSDCCALEEAGVEDVFLFPAHDLAGGYAMPEAEVEAFERVIRPTSPCPRPEAEPCGARRAQQEQRGPEPEALAGARMRPAAWPAPSGRPRRSPRARRGTGAGAPAARRASGARPTARPAGARAVGPARRCRARAPRGCPGGRRARPA